MSDGTIERVLARFKASPLFQQAEREEEAIAQAKREARDAEIKRLRETRARERPAEDDAVATAEKAYDAAIAALPGIGGTLDGARARRQGNDALCDNRIAELEKQQRETADPSIEACRLELTAALERDRRDLHPSMHISQPKIDTYFLGLCEAILAAEALKLEALSADAVQARLAAIRRTIVRPGGPERVPVAPSASVPEVPVMGRRVPRV